MNLCRISHLFSLGTTSPRPFVGYRTSSARSWFPNDEVYGRYLGSRHATQDRPNTVASYGTFKAVWRLYFTRLFKRSKFSKHACCDVCSELKAKIKSAKNPHEKMVFTQMHSEHIDSQMATLVYGYFNNSHCGQCKNNFVLFRTWSTDKSITKCENFPGKAWCCAS